MRFNDLDQRMRLFETAHDHSVLPGLYMIARLDGRGFTRLTKRVLDLEAPFDIRFRDAMSATVAHLMDCGFRVSYGYHQSDEISLMLHCDEDVFGRKLRKLISVLAGEASGRFSLEMGVCASFDCRISQLPTDDLVIDYFRWRSEDAHRNALNAHCYWRLRSEGRSVQQATADLKGMSISAKNELLFARGVNFNDLPAWQKRGMGLRWTVYEKAGLNEMTGEKTVALRRRVEVDADLPLNGQYGQYIHDILRGMDEDASTPMV